ASIQKGLMIDDHYPFNEAETIVFHRFYQDAFKVSEKREEDKDDIRPKQEERYLWKETDIKDVFGFYNEPYLFYFTEGSHKITLTSIREPFVIGELRLYNKEELLSYDGYYNKHYNQGARIINGDSYIIEAEEPYLKTSPTLNPIAEYQTSKYSPYKAFTTRFNAIGGNNWRVAGDTIIWDLDVLNEGFYQLSFKVMQNYSRGFKTTRTLYVNDEIPFAEAKEIEFKYSNDLQIVTVGGKNPNYIYLKEGKNTISLQASIGKYGELVQKTNGLILELRSFYREVVMRTGLHPDPLQDYLLNRHIKDLNLRLNTYLENLDGIKEAIISLGGSRNELIGPFERIVNQIKRFIKDEKNIQKGLNEFEKNIAALGTWVIQVSEQPLTIDQIFITGENYKFKKVKTNIFEKIWHEIILFIGAFKDEGEMVGQNKVRGETIEVWIGAGRDQTTLLRQLVDESFVVQNQINVDIKMVNMSILLSATLSGHGPDVAIGVDQKLPVNWGIRNAIVDVSRFADFAEIKTRFSDSSLTPLTYDGKTYGLPDTEDFLVTFYRNDILKEVGINKIPQTWEEVLDISPLLQKHYFEFYIPTSQGSLSTVLYSMIEQREGSLYLNNGAESALLERSSLEAFLLFTKLFWDYGFALDANFANRFRSGEMPIGIANYSLYNTLAVFAPEIYGVWDYGLIPGTEIDGVINNYTTSTVAATVIMEKSNKITQSWEFLKWWTSEDTQTDYARGMEAILGAAARYPTANLEAFKKLPWPAKDYLILTEQRKYAKGIPTVPGDYIVGRHIDNAFRSVLNSSIIPEDALYHYHLKINEELKRKRKELGL
ncbi:MAG: extracellular solute-binding protein, partial [Acholeplasmataceae bacterium]|nr:extracellular solute-binding protein [Acholeplasmataceae bacterium]